MTQHFVISSASRPEARFQRQQLPLTQLLEWEERATPYRGWGKDLAWGVIWGFVLVPVSIGLWTVFHAALGAI